MESDQKSFVRSFLPWVIAAAALLAYGITLNHWVSLSSVAQVVRVSGWDWQPNVFGPLHFLANLPLRWMPAGLVPEAMNLFSAVCAALTLALLARSVALLPHDRTHDQRVRETNDLAFMTGPWAWMPPILAACACGLQLTFWENATAGTGEILDLLVFAWCIRCLLEYRIDERQRWITGFAIAYGAGIANNWAMIAFFPGFLVALVWIRGLRFFDGRFLARTSLAGVAGLSLCLLLPAVQSLQGDLPLGFWQTLRFALNFQKQMLSGLIFNKYALFFTDYPLWVLGLIALVPILVMGVRWPSYFGDSSPLGIALATFTFHAVHAVILVVCVWFMFDPPFSPRAYAVNVPNLPSGLTLYYCASLSIGYFSGYFLIVFGTIKRRFQGGFILPSMARLARFLICVLLVAMPAGLVVRNLPVIREANGPALSDYASLMNRALPSDGAILLCDDPGRFYLMQASLVRHGGTTNFPLLNTSALKYPDYHRFLRQKFPARWPKNVATNQVSGEVEPGTLIQMLVDLSTNSPLYYLHPSFGYYFEMFYLVPHGLAYEMKLYPSDSIAVPPQKESLLIENYQFWQTQDKRVLDPIAREFSTESVRSETFRERWLKALRLRPSRPQTAQLLGAFYSRALTWLGAELQKSNRLDDADWCFKRALDLNPDNIVAQVNSEYNQNLRAGKKTSAVISKSAEDEFGKYRNWVQVIGENGPFDEPNFCYELGRTYVRGSLFREAWQQFDRVRTLAPENLAARLWLAFIYGVWQMQDKALEITQDIRRSPLMASISPNDELQLTYLEANAEFALTNATAATASLEAAINKYPADENLLLSAAQLFINHGCYTNAVAVSDQLLRQSPDHTTALINKGLAYIQLGDYDSAIPALNRLIEIQPKNYEAVFDRAIAFLRAGNLDAAKSDYETLLAQFPAAHQVYYGLGEIAFRQNHPELAVKHYQSYLDHAPTNTAESELIISRLKELKSAPP